MEADKVRELLREVQKGSVSPEEALLRLKIEPFEDLGYAKPDYHRSIRKGAAEVIYGAGKTAEQIAGIASSLMEHGQKTVLITRLDSEKAAAVGKCLDIDYHETARIGIAGKMPQEKIGKIIVAAAGTSDLAVAEEAAVTAEALGSFVERIYDVGVAGIHRLLRYADELMTARVIVAVAGMEGALASVIGGLAECPVIAVPTSVGYGASFGGLAALLSMLNSCASGVSAVNIDNGFGAAYQAHMINRLGE